MSWMEFISAMTGHVAWPIAVVALALIFRRQLSGLVGALDSWEGFGQKFTFSRRLARMEKKIGQVTGSVYARSASSSRERPAPPKPSQAQPSPPYAQQPQPPYDGSSSSSGQQSPYGQQSGFGQQSSPYGLPSSGSGEPPLPSYPPLPSLDGSRSANPAADIMASWALVQLSLRNLLHAATGESAKVSTDPKRILEDLRTAGVAADDLVAVVGELEGLRDQVAHGFHRPTSGEAITYASSATSLRQSLDFLAHSLCKPERD